MRVQDMVTEDLIDDVLATVLAQPIGSDYKEYVRERLEELRARVAEMRAELWSVSEAGS